jgi:hypothetical protein
VDVPEAFGVQGLRREELALGAQGRVLGCQAGGVGVARRVGRGIAAVGQEAIAYHPGHRRTLEEGEVPVGDVPPVEAVGSAVGRRRRRRRRRGVDRLEREQHARELEFRIRAVGWELRLAVLLMLLLLLRLGAHGCTATIPFHSIPIIFCQGISQSSVCLVLAIYRQIAKFSTFPRPVFLCDFLFCEKVYFHSNIFQISCSLFLRALFILQSFCPPAPI